MISKIKETIASLCSGCGRGSYRSGCDGKRRHRNGSLLLEIAIGISVIGLISGFFLTRGIAINRAAREQKTKNNIEVVTSALASYLATNKRLPRPSSPERKGLESESADTAVGTVPFNTLGIAERCAIDGNGRPLIYVVEPALADVCEAIYFDPNWMFPPKYFCNSAIISKIKIKSNAKNDDIVSFVIDTADNPPQISDENIIISPSIHTFWVRRNFFLIHYLKGCACDKENHAEEAVF